MVSLAEYTRLMPEGKALTFLREGEEPSETLTFRQLSNAVRAFAERVASSHSKGARIILLYPQGLGFVVAFLGCLEAGMVAVPVSLPNRQRGVNILRAIALDSGASSILSERSLLDRLENALAADATLSALPCIATEEWQGSDPGSWMPPALEETAPALIQYTSGSTGSPRGVIVTHTNLTHNQQQGRDTCGYGTGSVIVSWLPLFHDMGLALALMTPFTGTHGVLMSPGAFLQKPVRWLRAISNYRASLSCAPDFAYDLCARTISPSECEGLDLSTWTMALNGSEPVRASTFERFVTAFAPFGFRGEGYKPVYGLAEATVLVTGDGPHQPPIVRRFSSASLEQGRACPPSLPTVPSRALIGCGQPRSGADVWIVHPRTLERCAPGSLGEIWVKGPSVGAGYWGQEALSDVTFRARTADGTGPFLRTGDLGFWYEDSLYVTGRRKDLIIVRGRNHYPQDIETTVSRCHAALEPQRCAAFSVDSDEGEQLVIVQEVRRTAVRSLDTDAVFRAISGAVSREHALQTHSIVLIRPGSLPRTTSGKVQRRPCARAFLEHSLSEVATWGLARAALPDSNRIAEPERPFSANAEPLLDWIRRRSVDELGLDQQGAPWQPTPELVAALAERGALALEQGPESGGLSLRYRDALQVLEQISAIDLSLCVFIASKNYVPAAPTVHDLGIADPERSRLQLAIAAACTGAMKRCDQLARRHSPYYGRALRKKLTPNPSTVARLGALASRVVALECYVDRVAQVLEPSQTMAAQASAVGQITGSHLLLDTVSDLMQLGGTGWDAETARIARLQQEAQALRIFNTIAPEATTNALAVALNADHRLPSRFVASLSGTAEWSPVVVWAAKVLEGYLESIPHRAADARQHDRTVLLFGWLGLLAAVDATRQEAPSADLERASAWLSRQFQATLPVIPLAVVTQLGACPPTTVTAAPQETGQRSQQPSAPGTPGTTHLSASALRRWIVSWLARRLRILENEIDPARSFADYGLDSMTAVEVAKALSDKLGRPLDETLLWNFPTIDALIEYLVRPASIEAQPQAPASSETGGASGTTGAGDELEAELAHLEAELKRRS
jgi:acyl-CoA synthetase (AMP-forming)/AMP-acid ligase II/acyl carrier protein